jgi:hypothetical protein
MHEMYLHVCLSEGLLCTAAAATCCRVCEHGHMKLLNSQTAVLLLLLLLLLLLQSP